MEEEVIWYKNPRDLFGSVERAYSFIPLPNTSLDAQLNAIFRFSIYYATTLFILNPSSAKPLLIPLLTGAMTYSVHNYVRDAMRAEGLEHDVRTQRVCSAPTKDNPFMNVLPTDYGKRPQRPAACDLSRPSVSKRVAKLCDSEKLKDTTDIYGRNTGMRQFYSNPSTTIPNDQGAFAKWLFSDSSIRQRQKIESWRQD
jgi:hypothetical protein